MPIYEYRCTGCGHEFEVVQPVKDRDKIGLCGLCDEIVKRKVSDCTFRLKGVGWAKDGYCKTTGKINYRSEDGNKSWH